MIAFVTSRAQMDGIITLSNGVVSVN